MSIVARLFGLGERRHDALVERGSRDGDGPGPLDRFQGVSGGRILPTCVI